MTQSDKQLIDSYMDLGSPGVNMQRKYDMNYAGLCVEKMVERGDWYDYADFVHKFKRNSKIEYVHWLFNSQNFFSAMSSYLRNKNENL